MEHRAALLHGQRLECMAHGVSQIQGLAYVTLQRVGLNHFLLHPHRFGQHVLQVFQIGAVEVERE